MAGTLTPELAKMQDWLLPPPGNSLFSQNRRAAAPGRRRNDQMTETVSPARPLCRHCGKPISKRTTGIYFGQTGNATDSEFWKHRPEKPANKAEAQRYSNLPIVAVSWSSDRTHIWRVSVWDGVSYADQFFCKGACATAFAYVMARAGKTTRRYEAARAKVIAAKESPT